MEERNDCEELEEGAAKRQQDRCVPCFRIFHPSYVFLCCQLHINRLFFFFIFFFPFSHPPPFFSSSSSSSILLIASSSFFFCLKGTTDRVVTVVATGRDASQVPISSTPATIVVSIQQVRTRPPSAFPFYFLSCFFPSFFFVLPHPSFLASSSYRLLRSWY